MSDQKAYENFKKQVLDMADNPMTDKQIKDLWLKLTPSEKIFFYTSINQQHEVSEDDEFNMNLYDGLTTTNIKKKEYNSLEVNTNEIVEDIFKFPIHNLGKIKKIDKSYKTFIPKTATIQNSLKVKILELKKKYKKDIGDNNEYILNYDLPRINFNLEDFKNFLLYTYYEKKPYKQNTFKNMKSFLRDNGMVEGTFEINCKRILTNILIEQDKFLSLKDAKEISECLYLILNLDDYVYIYNNKININNINC